MKKEGILLFTTIMYKSGRHYAKWNKPDRERQTTICITYVWNLKKKKPILQKQNSFRAGGKVKWGDIGQRI